MTTIMIRAIWYTGTSPSEVVFIGSTEGVGLMVTSGDFVGSAVGVWAAGVGVCVAASVGVEVTAGEGTTVAV